MIKAIYLIFLNIVGWVPVGYTLDRMTRRIVPNTTPTWRRKRG